MSTRKPPRPVAPYKRPFPRNILEAAAEVYPELDRIIRLARDPAARRELANVVACNTREAEAYFEQGAWNQLRGDLRVALLLVDLMALADGKGGAA